MDPWVGARAHQPAPQGKAPPDADT
jgi:hypothetical protein